MTEGYLTLHGTNRTATSPQTLKAYRWAIQKSLAYGSDDAVNLLRATTGDGVRFIRTVEAAGLSPASTRVQLAGVRLFYKARRWADATQAAPFSDVRPVRGKTAPWDKRSPYTDAEVQALLEAVDARMRILVLLCAHAGLWVSEALALSRTDLNLETRDLLVRHGKGGKQRRVMFGETLRTALWAAKQEGPVVGGSYPAAVERL